MGTSDANAPTPERHEEPLTPVEVLYKTLGWGVIAALGVAGWIVDGLSESPQFDVRDPDLRPRTIGLMAFVVLSSMIWVRSVAVLSVGHPERLKTASRRLAMAVGGLVSLLAVYVGLDNAVF